jgi:hypothetical protein
MRLNGMAARVNVNRIADNHIAVGKAALDEGAGS